MNYLRDEERRRREQNLREFQRAVRNAVIEFMVALLFAGLAFWVLVIISEHHGG